ncbi:hypothetical protein SAM40697_4205 [Streptomyces ambofaciens]|uniref:Uncharacterized protein n=1 Tax=Streptomyces ambofaciens TaxID=1889 RepID=A0ABM6B386_STRAM|nr:hypothetical protein [Streptomyces ambofaciens]ANB08163.1 hypothetical protein SAM40697_4205 [Streptomyces ambofaciens]
MSLVELITRADARGLAGSGLACLDRCVPLLDGDDEVLRPLWAALAGDRVDAGGQDGEDARGGDGTDWARELTRVRERLAGPDADGEDEAVLLARRMLAAAPDTCSGARIRAWADACSVASLRIHRLLDPAAEAGGGLGRENAANGRTENRTEGLSPLVAAELRRQIIVLEVLAGHGPAGLRRAVEVSTEGRRVLRAVVSRRARGRGRPPGRM